MKNLKFPQPDGFWSVIIAALLWGTIGVATRAIYQLDDTDSLFINLGRILIATPILLVIGWHSLRQKLFQMQRKDLLVMVFSGLALATSHAAYFAAIRHAGVTIATLLTICVAPPFVALVSILFKQEILNRRTLLALGCAVMGAVLLVSPQSQEALQDDIVTGTLFALFAALTYGTAILCNRFLAEHNHPLQVTAISFSAGTLFLLIVNLLSSSTPIQTVPGWLLILYLGLVPSALAYLLLQIGLRTVPATTASIISMLDPLVAALLAWLIFGETLALSGLIGSALLLSGIFLLSLRRKQR